MTERTPGRVEGEAGSSADDSTRDHLENNFKVVSSEISFRCERKVILCLRVQKGKTFWYKNESEDSLFSKQRSNGFISHKVYGDSLWCLTMEWDR